MAFLFFLLFSYSGLHPQTCENSHPLWSFLLLYLLDELSGQSNGLVRKGVLLIKSLTSNGEVFLLFSVPVPTPLPVVALDPLVSPPLGVPTLSHLTQKFPLPWLGLLAGNRDTTHGSEHLPSAAVPCLVPPDTLLSSCPSNQLDVILVGSSPSMGAKLS
ncbi:hypothetical protein DSO57_1002214 [Entomophthora muscae]|uniref:Uncharacterized protein n=1 Tax=Entomophthora muscae TaxID=34485 RepID=A0ACC2U7K1_9FUNG|nr:hypothetical protein DSO57_1002214 [Entomophthora muscae]